MPRHPAKDQKPTRCIYINGETKTAEEVLIDTRWMDDAQAQRFVLRWLKNKGEYEDLDCHEVGNGERLWFSDDQFNEYFPLPVSFCRIAGTLTPIYGDMLITGRKANGYMQDCQMSVAEAQSLIAKPRA